MDKKEKKAMFEFYSAVFGIGGVSLIIVFIVILQFLESIGIIKILL